MLVSEKQLTSELSRKVAATIREEIARRRMSRQQLAERAKISISTLEKALAGRRPFTLATTIRLEEALGVTLRNGNGAPHISDASTNGIAPDDLGAYARRSVLWIEGTYLTLRPSFGESGAIYAYRTDIAWDDQQSSLIFRESERSDSDFTQYGSVAVPNQSGHIYLVTNRHGQYRLITVSRPTITGEMYGILTTLLAGRGSHLTPIAAPIAFVPLGSVPDASFGRVAADHAMHDRYQAYLKRTLDEPFAMFLPVA
ncbi:helix-turn-helix transcriptional regulator [Pseudorhodoplanes sp.]|uniref:helix-turn-helix domain-containing protein n=1 Tax=Pseudorhodoplanes sp. TaxID=1934341 RepID=UPI002B69D29D|nr:helix-turn-helix transcriptional regulator [Pseudorhodoplanes sp.]HWV55003.1 helix-turn-helix transcriptional regulator [Pseudorhodoplanes sp.]